MFLFAPLNFIIIIAIIIIIADTTLARKVKEHFTKTPHPVYIYVNANRVLSLIGRFHRWDHRFSSEFVKRVFPPKFDRNKFFEPTGNKQNFSWTLIRP